MKRGLIIDYNSVAAYLAHEGEKEQADFLNTLAAELARECQTHHHAEMQWTAVRPRLSDAALEMVGTLAWKEVAP